MIIIKNIILYFIQIRHTDDFPSMGTRLVIIIMIKKPYSYTEKSAAQFTGVFNH